MSDPIPEQANLRGEPAIRVLMMPRDTNAHGTIFGGVLLSYIDQAGAIEARHHTRHRIVTVAMDAVEFHEPVHVGDLVSFRTETLRIGRTSIRVRVTAEAEHMRDETKVMVTRAELVFVAIDGEGKPVPVKD